jgi:hypothetical protein
LGVESRAKGPKKSTKALKSPRTSRNFPIFLDFLTLIHPTVHCALVAVAVFVGFQKNLEARTEDVNWSSPTSLMMMN